MSQACFHILLALYAGYRHGLGIAEDIEKQTAGSLRLGPGTLYRSLKELAVQGLVEPVSAPAEADPRRKFYSITGKGRQAVRREARSLQRVVDVARSRQILPEVR